MAASAGDKPLIGLLLDVSGVLLTDTHTHTHTHTHTPHDMLEAAHYPQLTEVHRLIP